MVIFSNNHTSYSLHDSNPLGSWKPSTGFNLMLGAAFNLRKIPGGYSFFCVAGGFCYEIVGNHLYINEWSGFGEESLEYEMLCEEITVVRED